MISFKRTCLGILLALSVAAIGCSGSESDDTAGSEANQTASSGRAEVYRGNDEQHYFRLVAANGEPVLRSEGYRSREEAVSGVDATIAAARNASNGVVQRATSGQYFFNVISANRQIIGTSQLYTDEASATRGWEVVQRIALGSVDRADAQTGARFDSWKRESDGKHYFRLVATNGETVLHSQGYAQRQGVKRGMSAVRRAGETVTYYEVREAFEGQFYFVLKSPNGHVIANSELYARRDGAERGIQTVVGLLRDIRVPGEDTETALATCTDLPGGYWEFFEDRSWRVVSQDEWELGSELSDLEKAQLFAAVGVGDRDDVATLEAAFDNVDQGMVNYTVLEKRGKKYAAVEYGAGDNSYGAIFDVTSSTLLAGIYDGEVTCEQ